jgi:uncharacterized small protein (DUF1192 family)
LARLRKLERIAQLDEEVRKLKAEKEELGEVRNSFAR